MRVHALLPLVALTLALAGAGCHRDAPESAAPADAAADGPPGDLEPQNTPPSDDVRGTGRSLEGAYERTKPSDGSGATRYAFSADGGFTRTVARPGAGEVSERGTYVIDEKNRIALFVEGRNQASYSSAERPILLTLDADGDALTLASEDGEEAAYRRVGPAPGKAQGGPAGE